MLFEYIENLRSKPVEVRKTYTLLFAFSITFFVVLIWIITYFLGVVGTRTPGTLFGVQEESQSMENNSITLTEMFKESNAFLKEDFDAFVSTAKDENVVQDVQMADIATNTQNSLVEEETVNFDVATTSRNIFQTTD